MNKNTQIELSERSSRTVQEFISNYPGDVAVVIAARFNENEKEGMLGTIRYSISHNLSRLAVVELLQTIIKDLGAGTGN